MFLTFVYVVNALIKLVNNCSLMRSKNLIHDDVSSLYFDPEELTLSVQDLKKNI